MPFSAEAAEVRICSAHHQRLSTLCGLIKGSKGLADRIAGGDRVETFLFI